MRGFLRRLRARERRLLAALGGAGVGALVIVGVVPLPGGGDDSSNEPSSPTLQSFSRAGEADEAEFVPGEVIVRYRADASPSERTATRKEADASLERKLALPGLQLLQLDKGATVPDAVEALEQQPEVRYAEPNFIVRAQQELLPNDPRFGQLWGFRNTGQVVEGTAGTPDVDADIPQAWSNPGAPAATGSSAITVAVVDTGIAYDHPELSANIWRNQGESGGGKENNGRDDDLNGMVDDWRGWDFVSDLPLDYIFEDNDPRDRNGHGTHVAGTIGARGNNGQGVAGVSWQVKLMPLRVLDENGGGNVADAVDAFIYARDEGARIVNASLSTTGYPTALRDAIQSAPNTLFVVAAGNDGQDLDGFGGSSYPCEFSDFNIICVAATTPTDGLADFSNFSPQSVDLAAPGTSILSTRPSYADRLFSEDFETDISADWLFPPVNTWARTNERATSGSYSLSDSPGGDYGHDVYSRAEIGSAFDIVAGGRDGCRVFYELDLDTDSDYDGLLVQAQGGGTQDLAGYTGSTNGRFEHLSTDLSGFLGDRENVHVSFLFVSDILDSADGAYLDDVEIACLGVNYSGVEFEYLQGTSQATPLVAGAAALLWSQQPGLSDNAVKRALLSNVDPVSSLAGKTLTGGRLNADIPWPPFLDSAVPGSPTDQNRPRIRGRAQGTTNVRLYTNQDCSGAPIASGSAQQLGGTGITVSVPDNTSRTFWAQATDAAGISACSADSITYTERTPFCGGRPVTITGAPDADAGEVRGTPGPDVIASLGGNDTVRGRGGNDVICAGAGRDALLGGGGRDRLYGGGGKDRCNGGPGRDRGFSCERRRRIP